jgi:hypothetical protein
LIPALAGALPVAAVFVAYALNRFTGTDLEPRFICNPYVDGCVSISRAVRSGPGLHLFRAVMLPCAMLLFISWAMVRDWLLCLDACRPRRAAAVFWLGAVGALFLVLYVTWLGTEGEWYRWLRRYGVTVYFGGTSLAQLLLVWILWPQRQRLGDGRLYGPIGALTPLVVLQWLLGVFSVAKRLLLDDPELMDRIENLVEWYYGLPLALVPVVVALMFVRTGFRYRALAGR